ncbi:aquaporin-4-like [Dunckerocampus dactyliophorus]|uniref:aquaporin-4-like n=1 Tax=Dunckerocampus dactyliophorus TaxID=161453 RepID=UPI002405BA09|nr:aquaporin-4-like [Dunckerocampus dactyliophorus]XP_054623555.1 aquaporin-4-like [Dunckerocampus dactyliophorus]
MPGVQSQGTIRGSNDRAAIGSSSAPSKPAAPSMSTMLGSEGIETLDFWRSVGAEFLAMLLFVLLGVGSTISWHPAQNFTVNDASTPPKNVDVNIQENVAAQVLISLCFGLSIATMVQCFGHISGGHINPAVTMAMMVTRKIGLVKGLLYVLAQLVGGVAGAGLLFFVTPVEKRGGFGVSTVGTGMALGSAVVVELLLTFQLVFTIFATCDSKRTDLGGSASLAIGLSVTIGHLVGIPYTGASMNPARSFGPAMVKLNFDNHWVYWVGPILGAVIAALLYRYVFFPERDFKPRPRQVIPKDQAGNYREVKDDMVLKPGSLQPVKKKKRTERKDPPPTREVLSTV